MSDAPLSDADLLKLRQEREAFIGRVRENERLAAADPEGYRRKLRGLVFLGYGYIAGMLLVAFLLIAALVAFVVFGHRFGGGVIKLGLVLVFFLIAILKSLWVKIDPPEGMVLKRERAPRLWQEVEAVADRLGAPRPDEIRLDEEFNASAAQWPRFGILGGYRSILTLGMPLLASLDHDEAIGVIAHEFGHFSGKHGRFGVWIYRVQQTWSQLNENLSHGGSGVFRPFVNWFYPRFYATSFALLRQHEYEADRAAAEVVGAPTVASTLARMGALAEHQRRQFWEPLEKRAERGGSPAGSFATMTETMKRPLDPESAARRLSFSLAQPTDYDDSHPSLTDRLASLGEPPPTVLAASPKLSAAEALFGDALPSLLNDLERYYTEKMGVVWEMLAEQRKAMDARLAKLERDTSDREPTEDEAVELTYLRTRDADPEAVLAAYRAMREAYPESAQAAALLGQRLVEDDDPEGLPLLRFAAEKDPEIAEGVRRTIAGYHARQGDHAAFNTLREEAMEARDRQAVAESASVPTLKDELLTPDLSEEERARLHGTLTRLKGLGHAYAFRKRLPGTGELRDYLFFVPKKTTLVGEEPLNHFTRQLKPDMDLVRNFTLIALPSPKPWIARFEAMEGAEVFDHKEDRLSSRGSDGSMGRA